MNKRKSLIMLLSATILILTKSVAYAVEYDYLKTVPKTDVPGGIFIGSYLFDKGDAENEIRISSGNETKIIYLQENAGEYNIVNEGDMYLLINQSYDNIARYDKSGAVINNSPVYFFDDKMQIISEKEFVGHMKYEGYYPDAFYFSFSDYSQRYYDDEASTFKGNISSHYYKTSDGVEFEEITYDELTSLENSTKISKLLDSNRFYIKDDEMYLGTEKDAKKVSYEMTNHTLHGAKTSNGNIFYKQSYENEQVVSKKLSIDGINFYEIPLDTDLANIKCDSEYLYCNVIRNEDICYKISLSELKSGVKVIYDGEYLSFEANPIIETERTLVPIRFLFEKMGAEVDWEASLKRAVIKKDNNIISFEIDNTVAKVNDSDKYMDVPARLIDGKTMVPLRFLTEELGFKVDWDEEYRQITISEKER